MQKTIEIKVIPRAKQQRIVDGEPIKVYVTAPPVDDKANRQVIDMLSEYLDVPKRCIKIVKGEKSRNKLIEVDTDE